ncbi:MAG TPA: AraC family transcriptional regulator [Longimicrobium sp.]
MRAHFENGSLLAGDWTCPRTVAGVGPEERAVHYEVWLHRVGSRGVHVGATQVVGDASSAVFVNAHEPVRPVYPGAERQRSTAILLDAGLLRALAGEVDERASGQAELRFPAAAAPVSAETSLLHHALLGRVRTPEATALEVEETALSLLRQLLRDARRGAGLREPRGSRDLRARELAEAVKHLLARRFSERLTLEEIGRGVGASPFHLSRIFSAEVGVPIHQYLVRLRLRLALELMSQRPRDLSWVALEAGFASHSHFTAAFRAEYGVPPSQVARSGPRGAPRD